MIFYRRVPEAEPGDVRDIMDKFVGSLQQRIIHNKFADAQCVALNSLEKALTPEDLLRAQVRLLTVTEMLGILHSYDDKQTRNDFTITT